MSGRSRGSAANAVPQPDEVVEFRLKDVVMSAMIPKTDVKKARGKRDRKVEMVLQHIRKLGCTLEEILVIQKRLSSLTLTMIHEGHINGSIVSRIKQPQVLPSQTNDHKTAKGKKSIKEKHGKKGSKRDNASGASQVEPGPSGKQDDLFDGEEIFPLDVEDMLDILDQHSDVQFDAPVVLVQTAEQLEDACYAISQFRLLAVDCEGVHLSREGELCIIQVGTPERIYIFDVCTLLKLGAPLTSGLFFLEDRLIMKVLYDCRGDSDALFHQLGVRLVSVLDSQLVDIACRRTSDLFPQPTAHRPSLFNVLQDRVPTESKRYQVKMLYEKVKRGYIEHKEFWKLRPLSEDALKYAALSCRFMLPLVVKCFTALSPKWQRKVVRKSEEAVADWRDKAEMQDRRVRGNALAPKF